MAMRAKRVEGKPGPLAPRRRDEKRDTSDYPYVENYPALREWLDAREARCMWQVPMQCEHNRHGDPPTAYIECWGFPKPHPTDPELTSMKMAIVVVHARKMGWEIYTDCDSNEIAATLEDAERRMGLRHTEVLG